MVREDDEESMPDAEGGRSSDVRAAGTESIGNSVNGTECVAANNSFVSHARVSLAAGSCALSVSDPSSKPTETDATSL